MANANRPTGLSPVKQLTGAPFNGQGNIYTILAADTNSYAIGDPVVSGGSADANGVPSITLAGATGALRGVILGLGTSEGLLANPNNLNSTIRPSGAQSQNWYALVADDPFLIFEIQEVSGGTQLAATNVGQNTDLVVGSNNGYQSGFQLANASVGTTSTLQCKIMGLARKFGNSYGAYAKWLVMINNHELHTGTTGV